MATLKKETHCTECKRKFFISRAPSTPLPSVVHGSRCDYSLEVYREAICVKCFTHRLAAETPPRSFSELLREAWKTESEKAEATS